MRRGLGSRRVLCSGRSFHNFTFDWVRLAARMITLRRTLPIFKQFHHARHTGLKCLVQGLRNTTLYRPRMQDAGSVTASRRLRVPKMRQAKASIGISPYIHRRRRRRNGTAIPTALQVFLFLRLLIPLSRLFSRLPKSTPTHSLVFPLG